MDRRAEAEAARLNELLGADEVYRITGNRADAFYVAPKLLWYKKTTNRNYWRKHTSSCRSRATSTID